MLMSPLPLGRQRRVFMDLLTETLFNGYGGCCMQAALAKSLNCRKCHRPKQRMRLSGGEIQDAEDNPQQGATTLYSTVRPSIIHLSASVTAAVKLLLVSFATSSPNSPKLSKHIKSASMLSFPPRQWETLNSSIAISYHPPEELDGR